MRAVSGSIAAGLMSVILVAPAAVEDLPPAALNIRAPQFKTRMQAQSSRFCEPGPGMTPVSACSSWTIGLLAYSTTQ